MSAPDPRPPRAAEALLSRCLGPGLARDGVLGDLHEEFLARAARSRTGARLWYLREAAGVALCYTVRRVGRTTGDHGREEERMGGPGTSGGPGGRAPRPAPLESGSRGDGWLRDLRHGVRRIGREPGFAALLALTMAVAIGANAAIFGAVRPVVAPALPFPDADRVIRVWEANAVRGFTRSSASWHDARDWAATSRSFAAMAAYTVWEGNLVGDGEAQRIRYTLAEPDFFRVLGVPPLLGRTLLPDEIDPSRDGVVVLSHGLWTRAFGGDPGVLGRSLRLGGQTLEVVGVMPASFRYPAADVDAWKPWGMTPDQGGDRSSHWVSVIGRLAPGVSLEEAQQEMTAIGAALEEAHPDTNLGFRPFLEPVPEVAVLGAREGVLLLWGAVGLLLALACANVATLLLARGEARAGEMAVRTSLGARRRDLVRQLLVESGVTAALGGGLGLLLAVPATAGVRTLLGAGLSYGLEVRVEPAVVAYTILVTAAAGVGFGLLPALLLSADGARSARAIRAVRGPSGRRSGRLGPVLVAGQAALAVWIGVAAGLLGRSLAGLRAVEPGYPLAGGLTFRVAPASEGVERAEAAVLLEAIRDRLETVPGVISASAVNRLPLAGSWWGAEWTEQGRLEEPRLRALARVVLPGWVATNGLPLLEGRAFRPTDDAASEPVAVVSAAARALYWPDSSPVGAVISLAPDDDRAPWVRVVGVVGDVEATGLGNGPDAIVYTPFEQSVFGHFGDWGMDFLVRTAGEPAALAGAVQAAVAEVDPALPIFAVATLEARARAQLEAPRALRLLMGLFAGVALFLAALGVYGTLARGVARQAPEIGVRVALGAGTLTVVGGVLRRGLALAGTGLAAGLLLAAAGARWIRDLLYGVEAGDPSTFVTTGATLLVVVLLASGVPAWRAARVDPADALRRG